MQHLPARRAYLAAGLKVLGFLALPFALLRTAQAQEVQIDPGQEDSAGQIVALTQRLSALEQKVQRMEDEHSRIRAPLVVTGPDGSEVFVVDTDGAGRGRVRVGLPSTSHLILGMNDQGSGISMKDNTATTRVQIGAGTDESFAWVEDKVAKTQIGTGSADGSASGLTITKGDVRQAALIADPAGGALKTFDVAGTAIAELSVTEDTPFLLYDLAGKPFFKVGLPDTGKRLLTIGNPDATRVEVGITTDGTGGFVSMIDKSGFARAVMNVDEQEPAFVAYESGGKEVFAVGPKDEGGPFQMRIGEANTTSVVLGLTTGAAGSFISVLDKSGTQRASISADPEESPITVSDSASTVVFRVGPEGGEGPMNMVLGEPDKMRVDIGIANSSGTDGAYLALYDAGGNERNLLSTNETLSMMLYDPRGNAIFSLGEPSGGGPLRLIVGDQDKAHAMLGVLGSDHGARLAMFDPQGKERTVVSSEEPHLFAVYNPDGAPIFAVGTPDGDGAIRLDLGDRDKAHLQAGVLTDASGSYLSIYDQGGTERAHISGTEKSTEMSLNDSDMIVDIGRDASGSKAGLFISNGDGSVGYASIRYEKGEGGTVLVKDPKGSSVVEMTATKDGGGQVALTGPGNPKIIGRFWGDADGGQVALYAADGSQRVGLGASKKGDLSLYGAGGTFTATSGENTPEMQLSDAAGNVLVDAFINRNGLGAVSVGPGGNGVAATLGNMGLAASAILGRK